MVMQNPPEHTRLRRAVSWAFTPGRAEGLRPRIQKLADRVLDGMAAKGDVDVMAELAFPLPVAVIGEVLGVPPDETEQFRDLTEAGNVGAIDQAMRADAKLETYFLDLIARRRARPSEDLLGSLVGGPLSDEELLATAILLFIAGFITTTNLIGNGLLALLSHPDEMGRLGQDRGLLPLAVDEMIRYDGPVQVVARTVFEPLEILGRTLDAGDRVVAVLGAANRDPDRFEDPDRFDVRRAGNGPLGFGWGVHRCLGAPLARLEAEMVFGSLLERFSSIELLDANPPRRPGLMIRGLAALPVRVTPR